MYILGASCALLSVDFEWGDVCQTELFLGGCLKHIVYVYAEPEKIGLIVYQYDEETPTLVCCHSILVRVGF